MKPGLSERSPTLHTLADYESAIDFDLLLDKFVNQFAEPENDLTNLPSSSVTEDVSFGPSVKTEACVDLKPLLSFGSSGELFLNNVGKTESTCDPAEKANYFVLNKIDRYDDPIMNKNTNSVIYTPGNMSAAPSPLATDTMEEEFFIPRPYDADSSAQMLDFTFSNSDFVIDSNDMLNGAVCNNSLSSVQAGIIKQEIVYDTPENSSSPSFGAKKIFELPKMDFSKIQLFEEEIHTPDIINSIIEYERIDLSKFNISKKILIAEEMPSTSSSLPFINSPSSSSLSSPASSTKHSSLSKKRVYIENSDEEYVDDDNDIDYVPYEETKRSYLKAAKRGRPPKRVKSISSDDYIQLDPDEAKYREMRDRNNEASRRSRYKRKQKEMSVVDELAIEEERNVKLKAEVEELQKTVERFRDSLMKVMLSKR